MDASVQQRSEPLLRKLLWILFPLLVVAVGVYLWWRPIQAEKALEDASLEELQKITTQNPGYARALYHLGLRYARARQKEPAADLLLRSAELAPDDEEIWIAAAATENNLKGPHASFLVMNRFLKRHPESVKMKEERGSLLTSLQRASDGFAAAKHYGDAIQYYRMWLEEDPTAANAQQGMLKALQASDGKTKGLGDAWLALARAYEQQGDRAKAEEARKQAEKFQAKNEKQGS